MKFEIRKYFDISALGPGGASVSFIPFGGSGGGGGGGNGVLIFVGVCGSAGGPVAGGATWTPAASLLVGATEVNVIVVNNLPEVSIGASPQFSFDSITGTITRTNNWVTGDTIVGWYKPA